MTLIHLSELPPQRAEEAFGLVRLGSGWSQQAWNDWLNPTAGRAQGIIAATALGGVLLGLAAYEVRPSGTFGSLLEVPLFLAFELGGRTATRDALRGELDDVAERLGCGAVRYSEGCRGLLAPAPA